jgi:hypothetical protein
MGFWEILKHGLGTYGVGSYVTNKVQKAADRNGASIEEKAKMIGAGAGGAAGAGLGYWVEEELKRRFGEKATMKEKLGGAVVGTAFGAGAGYVLGAIYANSKQNKP